ncbi:AAA family ATPase [Spirosoma foliorum]|uniref:AAA family ATPase n=1 Tax=Spirosoma foliorum TaxID=2710596 RepID=A0A7G5H566_9BACT|nr:AAA family ATPase [Spirosoma foliorum]QMW06258.1 AAA family ATPase [Spirosoma foliorum]
MAKLTVKNVGPIREAELEVKKHTIFIGPQGSGKSTLAKLIAILSSRKTDKFSHYTFSDYNIHNYVTQESTAVFSTTHLQASLQDKGLLYSLLNDKGNILSQVTVLPNNDSTPKDWPNEDNNIYEELQKISEFSNDVQTSKLIKDLLLRIDKIPDIWRSSSSLIEEYIPSERMLLAVLSKSIWSLINSDIDFPKIILSFASNFERIRNQIIDFHIPFLNVTYEHKQGEDILIHETGHISLSQSASGYQSIIPLLLVVEVTRQRSSRRFIIEEPELNLYPSTQKDLIYNMVGGLLPNVDYPDTEWIITTHSPYVLSSFNTLMLAYKVAQKSDELRAEVEKIIPSRCWINPDEFAAYYVDNGTVRSIINEKTGLIADNELDDVSEDLAGEQDQLFELSRSVPRA